MFITYSVLLCKLATILRLFQSSSSQVEMVNHYQDRAIFQYIEHQLREDIFHNKKSIFDPLKMIYWKI